MVFSTIHYMIQNYISPIVNKNIVHFLKIVQINATWKSNNQDNKDAYLWYLALSLEFKRNILIHPITLTKVHVLSEHH